MPKAKKIFLLHERHGTWRIRLGKKRRAFCEACEEDSDWSTTAEAAAGFGLTEREVFRLAESDRIHFAESDDGLLLVCSRSLEMAGQ